MNRVPALKHDDRLLLGQNIYCLDTQDLIEHFDSQIYCFLLLESRGAGTTETVLTGEDDGVIGFWIFDPYSAKYACL